MKFETEKLKKLLACPIYLTDNTNYKNFYY